MISIGFLEEEKNTRGGENSMCAQIHRERLSFDDGGRDQSDVFTSQGMPRMAGSH